MSSKPVLVLVHSFPTNSEILSGLTDFLGDYMDVRVVNLPGFHPTVPPLKHITVEAFGKHVDQFISQLDAPSYIIGGISFGFLIVCAAKLDSRCSGVMAMEPFLNSAILNIPKAKQFQFRLLSSSLKALSPRFQQQLWKSRMFLNRLARMLGYSQKRMHQTAQLVDAGTFFSVAHLLLTRKQLPHLHELPHVLVGNFADHTIQFDKVLSSIVSHSHHVMALTEPIAHNPKDLSCEYFKARINGSHLTEALKFVAPDLA